MRGFGGWLFICWEVKDARTTYEMLEKDCDLFLLQWCPNKVCRSCKPGNGFQWRKDTDFLSLLGL